MPIKGLHENRLANSRGTTLGAVLLWLATAAGLVLSVMSALKVCTAACSETAKYTIFGMDFGWFGIAFFAASAVALGLRTRYTLADRFLFLLFMAAAGAELRFVWL